MFAALLVSALWGQGVPHTLSGTIQLQEGMYPEAGCLYITVSVGGDVYYIPGDGTYDSENGRWVLVVSDAIPGTEVVVQAIDSCWYEDGTINGMVSDSFTTDLGLLVLSEIEGIRPYLYDVSVSPTTGYVEDVFRFEVTYESDPWNRAPSFVHLYIDGSYFTSASPVDPGDSEYRDGADYFVEFSGSLIGRGEHTFFFYTEDEAGFPAWSETLSFVVANHPPVLTSAWLEVSPEPPTESSTITCVVGTATDSEGDAISFLYEWYVNGSLVGVDTNSIDGDYFDKHDEVWCVVTPYDGRDYGDPVETEHVIIENTPPGPPSIAIDPPSPFDFEDVTALVVVDAPDIDGDAVSYSYQWLLDGAPVATGSVLDNSLTTTGQSWTLVVTPNDGEADGESAELEFTVGGPVLSDGYVSPPSGHPGTTVFTYYVTYSNSRNYPPGYVLVDIDGTTYNMYPADTSDDNYIDGAVYMYQTTLSLGSHQFRFSAVDDHGDVAVGMEDYISGPEMTNTPPVIDEVSIEPSSPTVLDVITASVVSWHDDDGDEVTFTYSWYVNGTEVPGAVSATLTSDYFSKGDEVWCVITPHDPYDDGEPVETDHVFVVNAAPYAEGVSIDVEPAGEATELSTLVAVVSGAGDPDDDPLSFSYTWYVNGTPLALPGETNSIDGTYFDRGNDVFVQVAISDGDTEIVLTSATVTIGNALPVVEDFGIEPEEPYTDDELRVRLDYYDPDGDSVEVQYLWYRNGEFYGEDPTVSPEVTSHFDVWVLEVRLLDGFVEGEYVSLFDTVEIQNSLPEVGDFVDTITVGGASYVGHLEASDLDGDPLSFAVVDGPSGIHVAADGAVLWNVPEVDTLTAFDVTIRVSDGYDYTDVSFVLWVYPLWDPIFAPTDLVASGGHVGVIPLSWNPPAAFSELPYMPISFVGYEVWRATNPDPEVGDWTMLAETFVPSYADVDVEPYEVYYYYVVAVYDLGIGAPSNTDHAFCVEGELVSWFSPFTYTAPPVLDGSIDEAEWTDAMSYAYSVDGRDFKLYFKHDNGHLYIAVECVSDETLSPDDMLMVSVDDDNNDRWPSTGPSSEGEYRIKALSYGVEVTFQGIWGTFPDDIVRDVRGPAEGLWGAASDADGYVVYELAIPIGDGAAGINIDELGRWVGLRVAVYDVDSYSWILLLPAASDPEDPSSFGELYLESGAAPGVLCIEPVELSITLRQGESRSLVLNVCNCDAGYLNYTIHEACAPSGGLMRTASMNIVAYIDDASLVPQALSALGYTAAIYTDPMEFYNAVSSGSWDLVIVSALDVSEPAVWNAALGAYLDGSKLLIQTPDLDATSDLGVVDMLGLGLGEDLGDRGCALTWDLPAHPFFHIPMEVPPSVECIEGDYEDYGDNLIPGDYTVLASFDLYPYPNNAAIVFDPEAGVVVNSFVLSPLNDSDEDGIIDGVELLVNEISGLLPCEDVPWLTVNPAGGLLSAHDCDEVGVVFDATDLTPGHYYAYLMIHTNDPTSPMVAVPCHLEVVEPEPRELVLSFPDSVVMGCAGDEVVVPVYVGSLEAMGITTLGMTVSCDPAVAQPVDVEAMMGELTSIDAGPGTITFEISSEYPLPGGGPLALVHFLINDVGVGVTTTLGISGVTYNPDAYVTDVYTYPGELMVTSCERHWRVTLEFQVYGERADEITIGVEPGATDAFDEEWDEENVPPAEGWFDVWSDISGFDSEHPHLSVDIRDADATEIHWYIETGDSAGKVEWSFDDEVDLSRMGSLFLYCGDDVVDMKLATFYFYGAGQDIEIVYRITGEQPFTFHFDAGYTMFSLPLMLDDYSVNDLFPGNLGCWYYDNSLNTWVPADVLQVGVGYIILFTSPAEFTVWGTPVESLVLNLSAGWNLIGMVASPVDFSDPDDDPDGSILGSPQHAYYYDQAAGTYLLTDELLPGVGYFVAALNPCVLYLPGSGGMGKASPEVKPQWTGRAVVGDRVLEFGVGAWDVAPIPPVLPGGEVPKAYFAEDGWVLSRCINPDASWNLVLAEDATVRFDVPEGVQLVVDGEAVSGEVALSAGEHKLYARALPVEFALERNVPNPFNAATEFRFALPEDAEVRIDIFDLAGNHVRTLVRGKLEAGYHSVVWDGTADDGSEAGSGVYLCRMKAGGFSATRKVVLAR